jgi:hypothetical protein
VSTGRHCATGWSGRSPEKGRRSSPSSRSGAMKSKQKRADTTLDSALTRHQLRARRTVPLRRRRGERQEMHHSPHNLRLRHFLKFLTSAPRGMARDLPDAPSLSLSPSPSLRLRALGPCTPTTTKILAIDTVAARYAHVVGTTDTVVAPWTRARATPARTYFPPPCVRRLPHSRVGWAPITRLRPPSRTPQARHPPRESPCVARIERRRSQTSRAH